jgi:hypothetical protein
MIKVQGNNRQSARKEVYNIALGIKQGKTPAFLDDEIKNEFLNLKKLLDPSNIEEE